jgi:drug/metabolite transporter (DMT)-like permease
MIALGAGVAVTLLGFLVAPFHGWQTPNLAQAAQVCGAGLMLTIGYLCAVTAMRVGDIGFVAPFRYMSLMWATLLGWLAFNTLPDFWAVVGAAIVVATGIYTLLRERNLRRAAEATPASA